MPDVIKAAIIPRIKTTTPAKMWLLKILAAGLSEIGETAPRDQPSEPSTGTYAETLGMFWKVYCRTPLPPLIIRENKSATGAKPGDISAISI
jgi:hypothetical protein